MRIETTRIVGIETPVSCVGLGTWAIGGRLWGGADDKQSIATVRDAIERGINLIDTAPVYGFGRSESVVGEALVGIRDKAVIATKVALDWNEHEMVTRNSSVARIRKEIEDSLRRLRTDYIDLYQVHWPDTLVPFDETATELERLRRDGKILAIGVSNYSPAQMDVFASAAPLTVVQPPYNLFERAIEKDVLPYAKRHELVVLAYGALCRGLLSGRMSSATRFEGDDLRRNDPKFQSPRFDQYINAVAALSELALDRHGKSVLALAIRWVLDQGPTIALWGARRPEHLHGIDDVFGWRLGERDLNEIDAILAKYLTNPVGPEFMAPPLRKSSDSGPIC